MPRKTKPPRLYLHNGQWIIRDGAVFRRTGCGVGAIEAAGQRLAEYIAGKRAAPAGGSNPATVTLREAVMAYAEQAVAARKTRHRRNETAAQCARIIAFAGETTLRQITGDWCRRFAAASTTASMARHDLEIARAAVNFYQREFGLDYKPVFTLPPKGRPRTAHMTRAEAARILFAAHRAGAHHLVRYLLIGLYTGTRSSAITALAWRPWPGGGHFDLARGVLHRAPGGEAPTRKRKPAAVIPDRLAAWLRRWQARDAAAGFAPGAAEGLARWPVVHWRGQPVQSVRKAFESARANAGLPEHVIPHILRHSAITWAMQDGKPVAAVAGFFGVTVAELERTYLHHHPDYQQVMRRRRPAQLLHGHEQKQPPQTASNRTELP